MPYSKLSKSAILGALAENHEMLANIRKYQAALERRETLPADAAALAKIATSNVGLIETIEHENEALERELASRGQSRR